jgi:hypothetical protein
MYLRENDEHSSGGAHGGARAVLAVLSPVASGVLLYLLIGSIALSAVGAGVFLVPFVVGAAMELPCVLTGWPKSPN